MLTPQGPVVGLVEPGQQRRAPGHQVIQDPLAQSHIMTARHAASKQQWMDITGENRAALPCEVEIIERSLRNCNIAWGTPVNR